MDEDASVKLSQQAVDEKVDTYEAIDKGLANDRERAGKLFDDGEYFVPELLICSDTMNAGISVLKPHLNPREPLETLNVVLKFRSTCVP
jgi:methanogenic corrinoid protein MtbC1